MDFRISFYVNLHLYVDITNMPLSFSFSIVIPFETVSCWSSTFYFCSVFYILIQESFLKKNKFIHKEKYPRLNITWVMLHTILCLWNSWSTVKRHFVINWSWNSFFISGYHIESSFLHLFGVKLKLSLCDMTVMRNRNPSRVLAWYCNKEGSVWHMKRLWETKESSGRERTRSGCKKSLKERVNK